MVSIDFLNGLKWRNPGFDGDLRMSAVGAAVVRWDAGKSKNVTGGASDARAPPKAFLGVSKFEFSQEPQWDSPQSCGFFLVYLT